MRYYKLVSRYTNGMTGETYLESFVKRRWGFTVKYAIDKWTYPIEPEHKLFVFKDTEWLDKRFSLPCQEVYECECEVENPIEVPTHIKHVPVFSNHFENFWDNIHDFQNGMIQYYMPIPRGTVWCDAVKLIVERPSNRLNNVIT